MAEQLANSVATTLAAGVTSTATTISVASASGLPNGGIFRLILDGGTTSQEIVEVTAVSGTTLTVVRAAEPIAGQQGAYAHSSGASVSVVLTAAGLQAAIAQLAAAQITLQNVLEAIGTGGIPNTALTNNSVTIGTGTGLSGGGSVALGGSVTLTNSGVTAFNARAGSVTLTSTDVENALGYVPGTGDGSVDSVSVVNANGVSGTVSNPTTTPAISLSLGAITPTSVNGVAVSGAGSLTNSGNSSLTGFTGTGSSSGTNTGDQTLAELGGAAAATTLTINGTTYSLAANRSWTVGTVTSAALTMPAIFSVAGSPITTAGTFTVTLATQPANEVFAGPTSGAAAAPTFRTLVAADIPTLNQNTTGQAGTVATINGLLAAGTNVTITGSGTSASPYQIAASGGGGGGGVDSVTNSDGTITISPTTGAVVAGLNLANANTWTGAATFTATPTALVVGSGTSDEVPPLIVHGGSSPFTIELHGTSSSNRRTSLLFSCNSGGSYSKSFEIGCDSLENGTNDFYWYDDQAQATRFYIGSNGYMGFGTNTPSTPIHVVTSGSQSLTTIRLQCTSGGYAGFQMWDSNTGNSWAVGHQYGATSGAALVFAYGDVGGESVVSLIDYLGAWHPPSISDSASQNNSLYYSSTTSKLTYKDSSGTTHTLY